MNKLTPISKEKQLETYGAEVLLTIAALIPIAIKTISSAIALAKLVKSEKGEVKNDTNTIKFDTSDDSAPKVVERFISY
ncbi:hypothetical protein [Mycoplasma elephantis]|uniref:hypothetical protein n=1 Tax=Mycoplasma elephantis TaxID=114882 RepID=UPI000485D0FE|nr:hypothetical protein [Mycoplasma elephantis]